ncbi:MAG: NYN domain-containing protein [Lachnospiraceae bacterium]|nr:NYN domain-containing protein [Lachnospiraceae bacterium]
MEKEKRIALLIDAENTSVKYIDSIFMELKNYGMVTYKRMYGDFTSKTLSEWNHKALTYAVDPIQQPRYSTAKNAADIMLVIDAMDIMYTKNVDMFCIVSSDSDFTRLVNRISEEGIEVIGMGKSDASKTLKAACTIFKNLDIIGEPDVDESEGTSKNGSSRRSGSGAANPEKNITPMREIKKSMAEIVRENENQGDRTGLGGLKSSIQRIYKDFDERNYGYSSMSKFVQALQDFELAQERSTVYVSLKHELTGEGDVKNRILDMLKKGPMEMGYLGRILHNYYPDFDIKKYGYSQLSTFVGSMNGVVVETSESGNGKVARLQ